MVLYQLFYIHYKAYWFAFFTITMRFVQSYSCYVPILKTAAAVGTLKISEINYKNLRSTTGNTLKHLMNTIGTKTFTSDSPGALTLSVSTSATPKVSKTFDVNYTITGGWTPNIDILINLGTFGPILGSTDFCNSMNPCINLAGPNYYFIYGTLSSNSPWIAQATAV